MFNDKLSKYIDSQQNNSLEFLQKLIQIDSTFVDQGVYGNELKAQMLLNEKLSTWGLETRLFEPDNDKMKTLPDFNPDHEYANRPNLIAIKKGFGSGKSIILNGHIDTVPLDDENKWKYHPLSGKIVDGKIYGRGSCDMKAGLSALILATKYIGDLNIEHKGDIIIQSVVDEEGGGNGTLACISEGYRADAAIVAEPSGLQIFCASRGVFLLEIEVTGKAVHASYKWNGVNAIEKIMKITNGLKELETIWLATRNNPFLPSPTITIGQIEGGISAATVPGKAIARFDIKYLPEEVNEYGKYNKILGEEIKNEVEQVIFNICQGDEWLKNNSVKLNWYLSVMPHSIELDSPIIDILSNSLNKFKGSYYVSGLPSGADARHLQNTGEIPTVIFGPGDLKNAHSIDEYVLVEEYLDSIKILADTILNWTNIDN